MPVSKQPAPLAGQIIVAAFFVAMLLPLIGSQFINGQIQKEQLLILQWYGQDKGSEINARADAWFRLWAIQSGVMNRTIHMFDPKPVEQAAEQVASNVKPIVIRDSSGRFGSLNESAQGGNTREHVWYWWITAAFALCYFGLLRVSTFLVWMTMLIPVAVAILVTGHTHRRLKWHGFGGVNPLQYRAGIRMASWMLGIGIGMVFMPGALPPITVAACALTSVAGIAMISANRQKPN